nr:histone-lysine N-methyltransferase, H3 lysine-9 specific SUVH4 isoform X1 [Tanacetum cinerariifolium]
MNPKPVMWERCTRTMGSTSFKVILVLSATNVVDDPPVPPTGLTYITSLQFGNIVIPPSSTSGCNYKGSCTNSKSYACASLNGVDFPYVHRDGGRLSEPKGVVYELQVYETLKKGWVVRSWDFIPSGAFVCEYLGVLKKSEDANNPDNMYIMDIDSRQSRSIMYVLPGLLTSSDFLRTPKYSQINALDGIKFHDRTAHPFLEVL